jgi:hypothetical protein
MEMIPSDPKKRILTLVLLVVILIAVGWVVYANFLSGESAPKTVEEAIQKSGAPVEPAPAEPKVRSRGGSRTATPGN